jgi:hypothetical protein
MQVFFGQKRISSFFNMIGALSFIKKKNKKYNIVMCKTQTGSGPEKEKRNQDVPEDFSWEDYSTETITPVFKAS